jgi:gas vesicle protein
LAYQLTVAERYGDEQRAAVIRAKIAKIDNNVAEKKKDISDATAELTKSTDGNTDSAIENREVLRDQVQSYASYVEMLSKTGLKGKELRDRVKELKEEFRKNATEAGFSNEALKPYLKTFDDMSETIKKTPRNVDIEFKANVSPAQQAVNEFLSKLKNTSGTLRIYTDLDKTRLIEAAQNQLSYLQQDRAILTRYNKPTKLIDEQISVARAHLAKVLAMSNGGLVKGPGGSTSDSIPAMLSNGEFVVKASAVGTYGVDFLNAINQQKIGSFTSNSLSVGGASGSTVAYLSPEDRALLRAVIDRPVNLYTENAKIASSANAGNVVLAQRGTN